MAVEVREKLITKGNDSTDHYTQAMISKLPFHLMNSEIDSLPSIVGSAISLLPSDPLPLNLSKHKSKRTRDALFYQPGDLESCEACMQMRCARLLGRDHATLLYGSHRQGIEFVLQKILCAGDKVVSLHWSDGGWNAYGHPHSLVGKQFEVHHYPLSADGLIDIQRLSALVKKVRPRLVISGGLCPRLQDHEAISEIAHANAALHLVDLTDCIGAIVAGTLSANCSKSDLIIFSMQGNLLGPPVVVAIDEQSLLRGDGFQEKMETYHHRLETLVTIEASLNYTATTDFANVQQRWIEFGKKLATKLSYNRLSVQTGGTDKGFVIINVDHPFQTLAILEQSFIKADVYQQKKALILDLLAVAQSAMSPKEIEMLLNRIVAALSSPTQDNGHYLRALSRYLIEAGKHELPSGNTEQWADKDQVVGRDLSTTQSLINRSGTKWQPIIPHFLGEKKVPEVLNRKDVAVIIPTVGSEETLWDVVNYAAQQCPNGSVFVIDASRSIDSTIVNRSPGIYHVGMRSISPLILDIPRLTHDFGFDSTINLGKGWSMLIGTIIALQQGHEHIFFLDSDLNEIDEYDPLNKLATGVKKISGLAHCVIATPNRRNEVVHSVLNAMDVDVSLSKIVNELKCYIHFLAGERYLSRHALLTMPWFTNYGIETLINFSMAKSNMSSAQVFNELRMDGVSPYNKNETMIMYCSRLLYFLARNYLDTADLSTTSLASVNASLRQLPEVTILPCKHEESVQAYVMNAETLLPSISQLQRDGYIKDMKEVCSLQRKF